MKLIDILSRILYLVEERNLSIDVAFKKVCRGVLCANSLEKSEKIYGLAREFIASVIRLRCLYRNASRKKLARIFIQESQRVSTGYGELEPWCLYSVPKWLYKEMRDLIGYETEELLKSMWKRTWWLRLNTLKAPEEKILRILEEEATIERDRDLWYLYRLIDSKKPVRLLRAVKLGMVIPQNKASCMVVEALKPGSGDVILDMAAAPGVKTSLMVMLTEGRARVVAADLSMRRAIIMKKLLRDLGALNHVDLVITDSRTPPHNKIFNKALLDAPCTSSGSISKDPAVRLHLMKRGKVEYYSNIQRALLSRALDLAYKIVYSTCSILPEEGEEIVESFMDKAKLVDPGIRGSRGYDIYSWQSRRKNVPPYSHVRGILYSKNSPHLSIIEDLSQLLGSLCCHSKEESSLLSQ